MSSPTMSEPSRAYSSRRLISSHCVKARYWTERRGRPTTPLGTLWVSARCRFTLRELRNSRLSGSSLNISLCGVALDQELPQSRHTDRDSDYEDTDGDPIDSERSSMVPECDE
jgi:hypothetical protein